MRTGIIFRGLLTLAAVLLLWALPGCGDERVGKIERGVEFARARLAEVKTNAIAGLAFQSQMEMGAGPLDYLASTMDEHAEYPAYFMDQPEQAWCVVIKTQEGSDIITIDGYGEDLTTPIKTATVQLAIQRAQPPPARTLVPDDGD